MVLSEEIGAEWRHMASENWVAISSVNGLTAVRRQNNAELLLMRNSGTHRSAN